MPPIHVCHLIKGLGRGGAEALLPATTAAGGEDFSYSVGYFLPWKDVLVGELEEDGVPVRCFEARSNLAVLMRARAVACWLRESEAAVLLRDFFARLR